MRAQMTHEVVSEGEWRKRRMALLKEEKAASKNER
jgi:hypothetical protein